MLSFMQEQESPVQKTGAAADRTGADSDGTAKQNKMKTPLCRPQEAQEQANTQESPQEYLTVAAKDKNARKSTMLLAGLFCLGLLCLWFMIKKSTPQTTAATTIGTEETQIEMAITRLVGVRTELTGRMDEIVKKFYEFSDVLQVKLNDLVKNPFKHEMFLGDLKKASDTEEKDSEMMRRQLLRQQMQLLSIMQSEQGNCCMIRVLSLSAVADSKGGKMGPPDDRILYEGDSIRGFKVRQISDRFVKLESEGLEGDRIQIILKLSE